MNRLYLGSTCSHPTPFSSASFRPSFTPFLNRLSPSRASVLLRFSRFHLSISSLFARLLAIIIIRSRLARPKSRSFFLPLPPYMQVTSEIEYREVSAIDYTAPLPRLSYRQFTSAYYIRAQDFQLKLNTLLIGSVLCYNVHSQSASSIPHAL